ncbi:MAG: hypothetical protein HRT45_12345 [Bdellovibrionales bacterium]|nr:hypothetical protein [Bdellovibrionales bacterium]
MEPRLSTSKQWTSFPTEYLKNIETVFSKSFKLHLENGKIISEGRIYKEELLLRVGYHEKDRLKQSNFEISVEYNKKKDSPVKLIYLMIDVAATMLDEFFMAENDHDFPRIWTEYDVENRKVYLQYTAENSELEKEADKLLGEDSEKLFQGDADVDQIKAQLGIDPDASEDDEDGE